ncbi:DNA repair protein RadC [bacterium]|nr:DNA repair protein RadC [bacterium]
MEYKIKIQDLPSENRPRERMILWGPEALNDIELLAILIRSGTTKEGVLQLSERLLAEYGGLHSLFQSDISRLQKVPGIGQAKACMLAACFELSKRLSGRQHTIKPTISSPKAVAEIFMPQMRYLKQEELKAAYLDIKNRLLSQRTISIGTLDSSIVHPRDIFRHAVDLPCAAVILIHNHPTGDPEPSKEDIQVTTRIIKAGEIMGIPLLDHIIIGDGRYISLKEKNMFGL